METAWSVQHLQPNCSHSNLPSHRHHFKLPFGLQHYFGFIRVHRIRLDIISPAILNNEQRIIFRDPSTSRALLKRLFDRFHIGRYGGHGRPSDNIIEAIVLVVQAHLALDTPVQSDPGHLGELPHSIDHKVN